MERIIESVLREAKTIAVVGLSDKPYRESYEVAHYLERHGFTIIPVNPLLTDWNGKPSYAHIRSIPEHIDIVNVFRRSEYVPDIVDQAIEAGAGCVWTQLGVEHEGARRKAEEAGLIVFMNCCIKIEHAALLGT